MKRTVRFLSFFVATMLSLLCADKASAQVTAISANYDDSAGAYCSTPAWVQGQVFYNVVGSVQPLDSIEVYINYGDGSTSTYKIPALSQGQVVVVHEYATTGNYQISVTLTNTNTITTTVTGAINTVTNSCAALDGDVFLDLNSNCVFDSGEEVPPYHFMKVTNTTTMMEYFAYIDQNSHYTIDVPDGYSYTIEMAGMPPGLTPTCPNTSGVITQVVSGGSYTNDFGYECVTGTTDFSVAGWSGGFRPGFDKLMGISGLTNSYCGTNTIDVTLVLDPLLTYTSTLSGSAPTSVSGQTLKWTSISISQWNYLSSIMRVYTDPSAVLGTSICNLLYVTFSGGPDVDVTNDTIQVCALVTNSFDPNDKSVSPSEDALGTIHDGEMLSYHINFQNTGNDTAYNIVVTDSLDSNLDINTFQFLGASHPVNVTWLEGNIINFRFEGIYLPDSNVNEPASHGFIDYKIAAKTGLAPAIEINNTAYIYFDFNEAIVTNTTLSTIETPQSVQHISNGTLAAKVFPNPANNELIITTEGRDNFTAAIYDVVGRSVAVSVTNHGKVVINTSTLANGLYILSIKADGKDMTTKINIQH